MDAFSYLSVLLSIIIGLAITQILQGYRGLLLNRARVTPYAPTLIWSALIVVFATQSWWASFHLADHEDWTFGTFAVILLQTILLYMMAALVLPDAPPDRAIDLKVHYFREARPFFGITLAMVFTSLAKDWMIDGRLQIGPNLAFHMVFMVMSIAAMVIRRPLFHQINAPLVAIFIVAYVAILFARL